MFRSSITGAELVQLLLVLCRDDPCELQHGGSLVEALQCRYLLCKQRNSDQNCLEVLYRTPGPDPQQQTAQSIRKL